jgi:hypothetical protein
MSIKFLFIAIPILIGIIFLQIFLSRKNNKWLGLILPAAFIILSIITVLPIVKMAYHPGTTVQQTYENGKLISKTIITTTNSKDLISVISLIFLYWNIPTVISFAIYAICRRKRRININLEKMNIQDLQ